MTAALQDFSIGAGNDALIPVTVGSTIIGDTLVGAAIRWEVFDQVFGVVADGALALITKSDTDGISVTDSPPMVFTIALAGADTRDLPLGNYYHEGCVIDEIGGRETVIAGIMTVTLAAISND